MPWWSSSPAFEQVACRVAVALGLRWWEGEGRLGPKAETRKETEQGSKAQNWTKKKEKFARTTHLGPLDDRLGKFAARELNFLR